MTSDDSYTKEHTGDGKMTTATATDVRSLRDDLLYLYRQNPVGPAMSLAKRERAANISRIDLELRTMIGAWGLVNTIESANDWLRSHE